MRRGRGSRYHPSRWASHPRSSSMRLCSSSAKVEMRVAASSPSACCPALPHFGRESTRRAASSRCLAAVRATATSSMDTINIGASAVPTGTRALSIWAGGQHCHKCRRREGSSRSWTQGGHKEGVRQLPRPRVRASRCSDQAGAAGDVPRLHQVAPSRCTSPSRSTSTRSLVRCVPSLSHRSATLPP